MARLISDGNHSWNYGWKSADLTTNCPIDSEASSLAISNSTTTHTTPAFTPVGMVMADGWAVKIVSRVAAPTGTFTVILRNSTMSMDVATVVVNVSDIKVGGGWHFFKFASQQTLMPGTSYVMRLVCSSSNEVSVYRVSSQNFSKLLRTVSMAAPAAGDQCLVMDALTGQGTRTTSTVTMDHNGGTIIGSTSYVDSISVSGGGTLTWATFAGTTVGLSVKGRVSVWSGSTWNMGTAAARMPANANAFLQFVPTTWGDSTGFVAKAGSIVNFYGATKTNWTYLSADAAIGQTTLTVESTAGWLAGDTLCVTATTRNYLECSSRTIQTVDSATQVTLTSALSYAHGGTAPARAEVGNLSRNVRVHGLSSSLTGYIRCETTAVVNFDSVSMHSLGSLTPLQRGIDITTTTGSATFTGCAFHTMPDQTGSNNGPRILVGSNATNWSFQKCITFQVQGGLIATNNQGTWTIDECLFVGGVVSGLENVNLSTHTGTFTNNVTACCYSTGLSVSPSAGTSGGTFSNNTAHSNNTTGILLSTNFNGTLSSTTAYRNSNYGITLMTVGNTILDGGTVFGNGAVGINATNQAVSDVAIKDFVFASESAFPQGAGFRTDTNIGLVNFIFTGCTFGVASGTFTTHTLGDIQLSGRLVGTLQLRRCVVASPTEVATTSNLAYGSGFVASQDHDQTVGAHKRWGYSGTVLCNSSFYRTSAPSVEMQPVTINTYKLRATPPGRHFNVPVDAGQTVTFSCYAYKSLTHNGNAPRLLVLSNSAVGVANDTVLATPTNTVGQWLLLTGSVTATAKGVLEFTVECDGTAGSVYVSDISVNGTPKDTTSTAYWHDGQAIVMAPAPVVAGTVAYAAMS